MILHKLAVRSKRPVPGQSKNSVRGGSWVKTVDRVDEKGYSRKSSKKKEEKRKTTDSRGHILSLIKEQGGKEKTQGT